MKLSGIEIIVQGAVDENPSWWTLDIDTLIGTIDSVRFARFAATNWYIINGNGIVG